MSETGRTDEREIPHDILMAVLRAADLAGIGVTVTVVDDHARQVYVNEAATRVLGYPREELLQIDPINLVAAEHREEMRRRRAERLSGHSGSDKLELPIVKKSGQRAVVDVTVSRLARDGAPFIVSFFSDVTKQQEERLLREASERRFRSIIEGAPDGVVISRNAEILFANERAAALLGLPSAKDARGRSFAEFLPAGDLRMMRERVERIAEGEQLAPMEYAATRPDGSTASVELTSIPIEYEGARAVLGFARDATERAKLRDRLARTERLASMGTLAAGVAHEINNPLAYMSLGVEALRRGIAEVDASRRSMIEGTLDRLGEGIERIAAIVRELKTFARGDSAGTEIARVQMSALVDSATRLAAVAIRPRAELVVEVEPDLPALRGNRGRLEQVLVNLLVNAAQSFATAPASTGDRRVVIRARRGRPGFAIVEVEDNGAGIPLEVQGRVFDPFFTTKPAGEGTGLGLSISHEIVVQHGGELTLASEPGVGTTVRVVLPLAASGTMTVTTVPGPRSAPQRARILVVDDEEAVGEMLEAATSAQYEVIYERRGASALVRLASGEPLDVVLTDVAMPGFGIRDLHERIVTTRPDLASRLAFMTGGVLSAADGDALIRTGRPVLQKPFSLAELDALVERLLAE